MAQIFLADHANEKATYMVDIKPVNENGAAVVPKTGNWTLTTGAGVVINGRDTVALSPLATTMTIVLSGLDLAMQSGEASPVRRLLTVKWTYDSTLGNDLPGNAEIIFYIDDLLKVT